jgi:hypothetical protein
VKTIHATDLKPWGNQRTIATICFKRCAVTRAVHVTFFRQVTCVGCRAIITERMKEAEQCHAK